MYIYFIYLVFGQQLLVSIESTGLTTDILCNRTEEKVQSLRISAAFKIGNYIGLIGKASISGVTSDTVVRVVYNSAPIFGKPTTNHFYEAAVWPQFESEVKKITNGGNGPKLNSAFNTDYIRIFNNDPNSVKLDTSKVAYLALSNDTVWAYALDIEPMTDPTKRPTFNVLAKKEVTNLKTDVDDSLSLSLKLFLLHFPSNFVTITAVMIFERQVKNYPMYKFYHALVYTTEKYDKNKYYTRHYMRAIPQETNKKRGILFQYDGMIDWEFDPMANFCDELSQEVSAVVLLQLDDLVEGIGADEESPGGTNVKFIEFIEDRYHAWSMEMSSEYNTTIKLVDLSEDKDVLTGFRQCEKHGFGVDPSLIACDDYANDQFEEQASTNDSNTGALVWLWIGIIGTTFVIILLLAFGAYLMFAIDKPTAQVGRPGQSVDSQTNSKEML